MQRWLIFDADDTLWENNIYFDRAIDEFLDLLQPISSDLSAIRELLRQIELECIPIGGYGTRNFVHALKLTFQCLYTGPDETSYLHEIDCIGERLLNHPIDVRPGVAATLLVLHSQHRMILFSKGDPEEQHSKLERSGLAHFFHQVIIAEEKDTDAYHALVRQHELPREHSYMIGNSPRSDVLPALAAGLWAVFLPHPNTWEFEEQAVEPHPRLLHAQSFHELPSLLSRPLPELDSAAN